MRILVCDDLPDDKQHFVSAIREADPPNVEIDRWTDDVFRTQLNRLIEGANAAFDCCNNAVDHPGTMFDEADIVVVDNNLSHLRFQQVFLTGESIVGYIRAFSTAPYIVSINKNRDVDFDLKYLIGDYASRADLAVNERHLSNSGIWTQVPDPRCNGFLPWYWPALMNAADDRRALIAFLAERLACRVFDVLGFNGDNYRMLSRQARALLTQAEDTRGPDGGDGRSATFLDVFRVSSRSLPNRDDREILLEKLGRRIEGAREVVARTVAADIDFWFRRDVLGSQDVLVDIPHLLMRMPFLLGKGLGSIDAWNQATVARWDDRHFGLDAELAEGHLEAALFVERQFAPRPCFWWPVLKENEELNGCFSTVRSGAWIDAVFCEDRSAFRLAEPDDGNRPTEFVAQFEGFWNRRYVEMDRDLRYSPRTRLVL